MLVAETLPQMSVAQYLAHERAGNVRHELVDGYLYAMTGASDRHNEITLNLASALNAHLRDTPCRAYVSDMKVRVGSNFYYPDVMVRCGSNDDQDAYYKTDPVLIIEVLSPNTQRYDKGDKWLAYQTIDSLREYVLVAQDRQHITIYRRASGGWRQQDLPSEAAVTVELTSVSLALPLSEIYR